MNRFSFWGTLCAIALCASAVHAEPDTFGLGTGRDGAYTVPGGGPKVINDYALVTAPLAPGDTTITVNSASAFSTGELVMVLQTTGIVPIPASGSQPAGGVDLSTDPVGRWEFARLSAASGTTLTLSAPLTYSYAANVTQVISVPEYTTVTVNNNRTITAGTWNGSTGGVLVFLATGAVTNNGTLTASGRGFRGAPYVDGATLNGCTGLDQSATTGGARKGEGISSTSFSATSTGRGNVANGAGGGICHNSGGGGGGNGGPGGIGGNTWSGEPGGGARPVGGMGGWSLTYSLLDHLTLGGGGGAGHGNDGYGTGGATGGGAIFFRAASLSGGGTLSSNGNAALTTTSSGNDGAGGGGAGGSISIRLTGTASCGASGIQANGGNGGSVNYSQHGPGGGGGGGRILIQSSNNSCVTSVLSGVGGTESGGSHYGDGPTSPTSPSNVGTLEQPTGGMTIPAAPIVLTPANNSVIGNDTPVISGTASPNVTVIVIVDGVEVGRVTADAAGNWSLTPTTALAQGAHTGQAQAEWQSLRSALSASVSFTVDSFAPPAPVITAPVNGSVTNDDTPTITGTTEPGATVTVKVDGSVIAVVTADSSGAWSYTPTAAQALNDGARTISATATDAAGNLGPPSSVLITLDTQAPALAISTPAANAVLSTRTPTLTGTAEANATVTVTIDGVQLGTATANGSGSWSFTVPAAQQLGQGAHTASVTATDAAGNVGGPVTRSFSVDSVAPLAPVVISPANDALLNTATPSITGTTEPNATVVITIDGAAVTVTADASGNWSYTPTSPLSSAAHSVSVVAKDAAGNTSPPTNTSFTVDTSAPPAPVISTPANGSLTNQNRPAISGTAEANATVTIQIDGATVATVIANGTGAWSYTPTVAQALNDGARTISATATDAAGNTGPSSSVSITIDTQAPSVTISAPAANALLNTQTPTLTGTAEAGATVTVTIDGVQLGTATADGSGDWTFTVPAGQALGQGSHTASLTATDAASNTSSAVTRTFSIDSVAPAAPAVSAPPNGALINSATPTISGTAEAGATVQITIDGTTVTVTADANGNWSYTPSSPLSDAAHALSVVAVDAAGNTSPATTSSFTTDTQAPSVTITTPAADAVLNTATPTLTGTAEANATVTVSLDGTQLGTVTADSLGAWTYTLTAAQALTDGAHTASVTATDAANNVGGPVTRAFATDTAAPVAPVISAPQDGGMVATGSPAISGTAEPGATVEISIDGTVVTVTADSNGDWTYTPPAPLSEGAHSVSATATDAAGNVSPAATIGFTVDTVAPVAPVIDAPANGDVLATATPTITGTAEAGSTVEVFVDGALAGTVTASASGTWSFTPASSLAEGSHTVSVTSHDAANNSTSSGTVTFSIDLTAPSAPVIASPVNGSAINDVAPTISGIADPGVTVDVYVDGVLVGTVTADATGMWSLPLAQSLSEGMHSASATARDAANNSAPGMAVGFTVDVTAPAAPVIATPADASTTKDATPIISGMSDANVTIEVTIDGVSIGTVTADAAGNWSLATTTALSEGSHTVGATATDAANNSTAATPNTFTVDLTAPSAPQVSSPTAGETVGSSTPVVTGTGEPGTSVDVYVDGVLVGTTTVDVNGDWTFTLPTESDGSHTIEVVAKDDAGNTSPTTSVPVTVDTTAPAAPVITTPVSDALIETATPTVSGTAEPASIVELTIDGVVFGTASADASGNWSYALTMAQALTEGPHTASATATDAVGNTSPTSMSVTFTVSLGMNEDGGMTGEDGGMTGEDGGMTGEDGGMTGSDGGMTGEDGGMTGSDGGTIEQSDGGDPLQQAVSFAGGGCGCAAGGADPGMLLFGLAGLVVFARRRRRS